MAILEAAVAGIPVVATAVGGVPAMLGEDSGTLVPPGNAGALGAAVRRALGDPQVARDLVSALRDRVMGPRVGEWIERYAALYRGLVEQESEADA
jgi:glycosyltransferase involved in cell wall biosynthesis